jgi:hypothetical protein
MQTLQVKAEQLKNEQIQLKMSINEKNTANILCCLFAKENSKTEQSVEDPRIEALLRRPTEEIPDASKLPALQPLILPSGAQHSKKGKASDVLSKQELPDDGIDYELLGKDRSKCTPAELDQIRRERNRMHAKRTRDRKRLFMEEMAEMCKQLEGENFLLQRHLNGLHGVLAGGKEPQPSVAVSPSLPPTSPSFPPAGISQERIALATKRPLDSQISSVFSVSQNGVTYDQIKTLLEAASSARAGHHPYSSGSSFGDSEEESEDQSSSYKRRRLSATSTVSSSTVPKSITTSTAASSMTTIGV